MKSYDELKAEIKVMQQQMTKRKRTNVLTHKISEAFVQRALLYEWNAEGCVGLRW